MRNLLERLIRFLPLRLRQYIARKRGIDEHQRRANEARVVGICGPGGRFEIRRVP